MNDSQDRTDAFGEDGFDWSSESRKLKTNFDTFGLDRKPRYDGFDRSERNGDSVFSDGFLRTDDRSFSSDGYSRSSYEARRPARDDSVYSHSEIRRRPRPSGDPGHASASKKTAGKKKNPSDPRKTGSSLKNADKRKPSQSQNNDKQKRKQTSDKACAQGVGPKKAQAKPESRARKMAAEGERRRREKSSENYDKAIRQGKSKDELRKIRIKKKRRARKIKIAVTTVAVFAFSVIIALIFCFAKGAPIEKIVIEGASLYSDSEILTAAGISEGDNMLMIRQKGTNGTVTKALPYISHIKVDYQLPDTLRLVVSETTDKYYIVNGDGYICVDADDKIVSDVKKKVKGKRYRIEGLEQQEYELGTTFSPDEKNGNREKYKIAKKIACAIENAGLKNCSVINVENTDRIYVVYNAKVWMYLKADSDFEYEMRFAYQAINDSRTKEIISSAEKCYIDLRLGNQAVFKTGELS